MHRVTFLEHSPGFAAGEWYQWLPFSGISDSCFGGDSVWVKKSRIIPPSSYSSVLRLRISHAVIPAQLFLHTETRVIVHIFARLQITL
jgi:hypothetical protein